MAKRVVSPAAELRIQDWVRAEAARIADDLRGRAQELTVLMRLVRRSTSYAKGRAAVEGGNEEGMTASYSIVGDLDEAKRRLSDVIGCLSSVANEEESRTPKNARRPTSPGVRVLVGHLCGLGLNTRGAGLRVTFRVPVRRRRGSRNARRRRPRRGSLRPGRRPLLPSRAARRANEAGPHPFGPAPATRCCSG